MLDNPEKIAETIKLISPNWSDKKAIMEGFMEIKEGSRRFSEGVVRVTDILNPKRAYYTEMHPELEKEISPERKELMWAGADFHVEFGYAVSQKEYVEQFVGFEGIMGRIDIFKDHPVEVKRTKDISPETDIIHSRPDNIEQLGMYCAMTNVNWGRLVFFIYRGEQPGTVYSFKVEFDDLKAIREIMKERKTLLLDAWQRRDPSGLPACPWFGKGCEAEKVCDCANSRPFGYEIVTHVSSCSFEPDVSKRLTKQLNDYLLVPKNRMTYWDIISPRKFWFKREVRRVFDEDEDAALPSESLAWRNVKHGIEMHIKHAPKIGFKREYIEFENEKFPLESMRNVPTVITFPKTATPLSLDLKKILTYYRDDILRLGMQCALANKPTGRWILYYQNIKDIDSKLEVYMIHFKDIQPYTEFMKSRIASIHTALRDNDFSQLPRCSEHKCRYKDWRCPYIEKCHPDTRR